MESDYRVYLRTENRPDLLRKAVDSIKEFWPVLTIVDNSPESFVKAEEFTGATVFSPIIPLTFTQSHNFFFKDAKERGAKFIIWMHNDAEAVDGGHLKLLELARRYTAEGRKWGLIWTNYDSIAAVNLAMIDDVGGYDTVFPKYFCDNDHTRRMQLTGWETISSGIHSNHLGSQTIKSDPDLTFMNTATFDLYKDYYVKKWGGEPEHETYPIPFNTTQYNKNNWNKVW